MEEIKNIKCAKGNGLYLYNSAGKYLARSYRIYLSNYLVMPVIENCPLSTLELAKETHPNNGKWFIVVD